jgi:cytochrome c oxidase subunit 3
MLNREGISYEQAAAEAAARRQTEASRFGLWVLLTSIAILFLALSVVLVLWSRTRGIWTGVPMPFLAWVSTALLIASSVHLHRGNRRAGERLGWAFLAAQILAWWQIVSIRGPGAWFFWTFSALHAAHVLGGLAAFRWARLELARIYWHFLTGLWLYVVALFLIARAAN